MKGSQKDAQKEDIKYATYKWITKLAFTFFKNKILKITKYLGSFLQIYFHSKNSAVFWLAMIRIKIKISIFLHLPLKITTKNETVAF